MNDNLPNTSSGDSDKVAKVRGGLAGREHLLVNDDLDKDIADSPSVMTAVPEPTFSPPFELPEPPFSVKFLIHEGEPWSAEQLTDFAVQKLKRIEAEAVRRLTENILPFNVVDQYGMLLQLTEHEKATYAEFAEDNLLQIKFAGPHKDEDIKGFNRLAEKPVVVLRIDLDCFETEHSALSLPAIRQPIHKSRLRRFHLCLMPETDDKTKVHIRFHDGAFFISELLEKSGVFKKHPLE